MAAIGKLKMGAISVVVGVVASTFTAAFFLSSLEPRIAALETKAAIPGPEGKQGPPGKDGEDGKHGADGSDASFPTGAVVAFDLPNGCPAGWTDLGSTEPKQFAGRTIVAVGQHQDRLPRTYRNRGGAETHKLETAELPKFVQTIKVTRASDGAGPGTLASVTAVKVNTAGESSPHNNMPPYVALYFCKKD